MRLFLPLFAALILAGLPASGSAQEPSPAITGKNGATTEPQSLDSLFSELKRETNEKAAERIAQRIWDAWMRSGSASVDLMMQRANDAMQKKNFPAALDFLDQVVVLAPDYSEGWNRRATLHFMMENFQKSMADIERTLELEPRHFGALSGMAQILKNSGHKKLALDAYERALAVYPMMRSAQNEVATLSEELAGEGI
jgi:tetratricopeptide (TPR) repeat protein